MTRLIHETDPSENIRSRLESPDELTRSFYFLHDSGCESLDEANNAFLIDGSLVEDINSFIGVSLHLQQQCLGTLYTLEHKIVSPKSFEQTSGEPVDPKDIIISNA